MVRCWHSTTHQKATAALFGLFMAVCVPPANAQIDPPNLWQSVLVPSLPLSEQPFLEHSASAWADVDGDGDLDLFYSGFLTMPSSPGPFAQLYENNGDYNIVQTDEAEIPATRYTAQFRGTLHEIRETYAVVRGSVAWGDYNGDGWPDLATTGITANGTCRTRIYRNEGLGEIYDPGVDLSLQYAFEGVSDGDLAWGDFNNDGSLDLIFSGQDCSGEPVTRLYINNRDTGSPVSFDRASFDAALEPLRNTALAPGDFDNDMDLDLLMTGVTETGRFVTILYRNQVEGMFVNAGADLPGLLNGSVAWGDGDADGDLDILLTGAELGPFLLGGRIFVLANEGGVFSSSGTSLMGLLGAMGTGRYAGDAEWGDFNNDGLLDFFVNGFERPRSNEVGRLYESLGNMNFVYSTVGFKNGVFTGSGFGSTFWGDYDSDGYLDLFASGRSETGAELVRIYRKDSSIFLPQNARPQPPGFLSSRIEGNQVILSWGPADDDHTPAAALTYNVQIGASPGAGDVMPSMSRRDSGARLITAMGNAGHNLGWRLIDLNPGTYYWTVQSIDSGFKGSEFSAEQTFTVPAQ